MCECEQEEYRTTELELRVSQLENEVETLTRAVATMIANPASPHAAADAAANVLGFTRPPDGTPL